MRKDGYDIQSISMVLFRAMEGVSKNVFLVSRPKAFGKMDDFVVLGFPNRFFDNLGRGSTRCVIELFARDGPGGVNVERIADMQLDVYDRLPIVSPTCIIHHPSPVIVPGDNLGFHAMFIYCDVEIV